MALPSQLKYGNKPETASARSYTSIIQPEGAQSKYGPNSTVKFNIPCQNNTVLVGSETYLKLTLSGITNGVAVNPYIRLDGAGIHGAIQRCRIFHSSSEIFDLDNYGNFAKMMMSLQQSSDSFCSKQNVMAGTFNGYNSGGDTKVSFLPLIGERLTHTGVEDYVQVPAGGVVADRNYAISLISYVGTLGGDKYIPCYEMTSSPLRLELQFVSSVLKFVNAHSALANNSFEINNLELVCTFIELSDDVVATLRERQMSMNSPLQYVVPNYSNVSANAVLPNSVTRVTHQLSARYASLKSIFCTMRSKADGELRFFPLSSTHFNLKYWNFRIGSQLVPSKQVATLQESYCELLKAIGSIADLNHEPSISHTTYVANAFPVASGEEAGFLAANTKSNSFAIGLDLETYATADRDALWAGLNTITSDIFFNGEFDSNAGAPNVKFDFYSMFDQVLVFENGSVRVVK